MSPELVRLHDAIEWMVEEGAGYCDDSQAAVCDAYNALPGTGQHQVTYDPM